MENTSELVGEKQIRKHLHELDREGKLPIWVQVRNILHRAVHDPEMEANSRLPSEQNLCQIFGASRPIIRMALDNLASAGLITKVARQGIFVAPRQTDVDFVSVNSGMFGEISRGHKVTTQVLYIRREMPSDREKEIFSLPANADVVRVQRIYYVDNVATAISTLSLAGSKIPDIEEHIKDNVSVYGLLMERYGLAIKNSERWFEAIMPSLEEARLLGVDASQPMIGIESIGRTTDGQVLEYYNTVYNTLASRIRLAVKSD